MAPAASPGPYGRLEQGQLTSGVVDERLDHLAHERVVVESNVPELFPVQDDSGIGSWHASIVSGWGRRGNRRNTLDGAGEKT